MIKKAIFGALLASAIAATPAAAEPDYAASVKADYDKSLATLWDHFHRNPELSFREFKTAARRSGHGGDRKSRWHRRGRHAEEW